MGNQPFLVRVREFIGSIGFDIFLWSIRMSETEYLDTISDNGSELIFDLRGENYALRERVANLEKMITRSA